MPGRNNSRKYPGIKGRRPDLKATRIKEAGERQEAWDQLSLKEQLVSLDSRLGRGVGAQKQRKRLLNKMNEAVKELVTEAEKIAPHVQDIPETMKRANEAGSKRKKAKGG